LRGLNFVVKCSRPALTYALSLTRIYSDTQTKQRGIAGSQSQAWTINSSSGGSKMIIDFYPQHIFKRLLRFYSPGCAETRTEAEVDLPQMDTDGRRFFWGNWPEGELGPRTFQNAEKLRN
jgi:hypothetical protein